MSAGADALYDLDAARTEEQRRYMERLEAQGICIFCPEHVAACHPQPIEHVGEHWFVTRNAYPYRGTAAHFLIVARRHVASFHELPDAAGAELWAIRRALRERLGAHSTATIERSGRMALNGASVAHLHTHFVIPARQPEATVRFRVSAHGAGEGRAGSG